MATKWKRYRFREDSGDYRPVVFVKAYPWWCSGYAGDSAIIVAFLPADQDLAKYWPTAYGVEVLDEEASGPTFTSRFAKPDYYDANDTTEHR